MSVCNYNYPVTYENVTHNGKTGKMTWNTETEWFFKPDDYSDNTRYPRSQIISSMGDYGKMPNIPCTELMANAFCSWDSSKADVKSLHRDWLMNNDPAEYRKQYVNCSTPGSTEYSLRQRLPTKVAEAMERGNFKMYRGGGSRRHKSKQRKSRKNNKSKKRKSRKANRRRR